MIGRHSVAYEPSTGFFLVCQVGELSESDAVGLLAAFDELNPSGVPPFVLCSGFEASSITPAARKAFQRERATSGPTAFVAFYGGSRLYRAAAILLTTALKLTGLGVEASMEADEAAARAWLTRKQEARAS